MDKGNPSIVGVSVVSHFFSPSIDVTQAEPELKTSIYSQPVLKSVETGVSILSEMTSSICKALSHDVYSNGAC